MLAASEYVESGGIAKLLHRVRMRSRAGPSGILLNFEMLQVFGIGHWTAGRPWRAIPPVAGPVPLRTSQLDADAALNGAQVDVVVLSDEPDLFDAIRDAIGERNPVWRASSAAETVDLLVAGRCGVLLIDLASVTVQPDLLVHQILAQFPDVVLCAAGLREDEPRLAHLVSEGLVYRYMHKPLSSRRAGMFLRAAMRQHRAKREGPPQATLVIPDNVTALPSRFEPLKWVFGAFAIALFVLLLSVFVDDRPPPSLEVASAPAPAETPAPVAAPPSRPANPVLSRARAALDAGRFESPPGRNALDLYRAVVLAQPDNAEARAGLDSTLEHVIAMAHQALDQGHVQEAGRLVGRVLEVDPERGPAVQLAALVREKMPKPPAPAPVAVPTPAPSVAATSLASTQSSPAPTVSKASAPASTSGVQLVRAPTRNPSAVTSATTSGTSTSSLTARNPGADLLPVPAVSLRGPVTRLPAVGGPDPVPAKAAPPTPIVVRPDPLAARIVNAGDTAPARPRIYARKVESLPIAGYDRSPESEATASPAATETDTAPATTPAASAVVLPAESFERLEVTDPVYPISALRTRTQGWVQLEFTITPSGTVRDIEVVGAEPRGVFDRSATDALSRWRFKPRLVNGQPATQRSSLIMRFNLDS